ncbi:MAG: ABC transporter permease [Bryobacteraceae bacterium]
MNTDLALAFRALRKTPAFTLTAVLLIALGIGANAAMFSIVDAWLLRPLRFRDPHRLVVIWRSEIANPNVPAILDFYFDYLGWRDKARSFESLAGSISHPYTVTGEDRPEELRGLLATEDLFSTLGVVAARGRTFDAGDLQGAPVAVISDGLWRRRYASSPDVVGRVVNLSGRGYKIVGVLPPGFSFRLLDLPAESEIFTLLRPDFDGYRANQYLPISVVGRLRPGVSAEQARAELSVLQRQFEVKYDIDQNKYTLLVAGLQEDNTRSIRSSVMVLAATSGFVLLIACANLASLLLGRASERKKELAIRAALGSSRARLMAPLAAESGLIALAGAGLGILVAVAAVHLFVTANPLGLLPPAPIALNSRVLALTAGLALLTAIGAGLAPALVGTRVELNEFLKEGGRGGSAAAQTQRMRRMMVIAEVAISIILLTGAGLMIESFIRLASAPMGFRAENLWAMRVLLPKARYREFDKRLQFQDRLLAAVRAIPGVQTAAISALAPLSERVTSPFTIEGKPAASEEQSPKASEELVTDDFFAVMGIPVLKGRAFSGMDQKSSNPVVIINDETAHRYFPIDPIGQRLKIGGPASKTPWLTIVGITGVTKFKQYNTNAWVVYPQFFVPPRQASETPAAQFDLTKNWVAVRTSGGLDSSALNSALRRQVWSVDSALPVKDVRSMGAMVSQSIAQPKVRAFLLGLFAGLALVLAAIGVYGIVSQLVTQRTHEIAIRVAVGASVLDVVGMIVKSGLALTAAGILIGVAGALALTRVLQSLLFGVKPTSIPTFAGVSLLMLLIASLASLLPALRGARINPVTALREPR